MRHGVTIFPTDRSIGVVELARAIEERGLDSLWLPEHTHIPTSRWTPWPVAPDQPLPEQYARCLDPLVALAVAAACTTGLRLGTGILLAAQRDPIVTAKALASLDLVSGGRVAVGVGFGWNQDEAEDHGVPFRHRREVAREHVQAMRALWEHEEAGYDGEHVAFQPSWSWPKPVQSPLPVLLGGVASDLVFSHVVEYCDGWVPIGGGGLTEAIPRLRRRLDEAGRDPSAIEVVPLSVRPDAGKLEHYERVGVTECVFDLPSAPADEVLPVLDRYAELVARV